VEDCADPAPREKLEIFSNYLFLVFHSLINEQNRIISPIKVLVFPHLILSFHRTNIRAIRTIRERLETVYHNRIENSAWVIHGLLDAIIDNYFPVVDRIVQEVENLDDIINTFSGREMKDVLKRLSATRKRLGFLRTKLWSKRDILMSLIGRDWQMFLTGVQIPYLRDVYDHVVTMLSQLDNSRDNIQSLESSYLASVNIDVAGYSNDVARATKQLSAVATVIMPLAWLTGLLGMNVPVPGMIQNNFGWGDLYIFEAILGVSAAFTLFSLCWLRRRGFFK